MLHCLTLEVQTIKIQEQQWYRETAKRLRQYPTLKKRIEIIDMQMIRQAGPSSKATMGYGLRSGSGTNLELEWAECSGKIGEIDLAMQVLDDTEKQVIKLRYFENIRDYQIYQAYKPMGPNRYYQVLNSAMEKIAQCLGYKEM